MENKKNRNPLHGVTLAKMVADLEKKYGFARLGEEINIKCFTNDPSLKSSLVFLRRTPWARKKVEKLYLESLNGSLNDVPKKASPHPRNFLKEQEDQKELWPDMEL